MTLFGFVPPRDKSRVIDAARIDLGRIGNIDVDEPKVSKGWQCCRSFCLSGLCLLDFGRLSDGRRMEIEARVGRTPSSAADPPVGLYFAEKIGVLANRRLPDRHSRETLTLMSRTPCSPQLHRSNQK